MSLPRGVVPAEPGSPRHRAGQLAAGFTTSLVSLAVTLLVLEGLVRWLAPEPVIPRVYVSDPVLWHAMRPHVRAVYRTSRFKTIIETNADGFRDVEFGPKPEAAIRILVIGDSFTAGAEVSARDTYPKVLERRLRKRPDGGRYQVFNLGVRAYGTLQEIRLLETRGLSYRPDVVILQAYAVNDLYESLGQLYTEQNGNMLSPVARGPGATGLAAAIGEGLAHEDRAGMGSAGGLKRWLGRHSRLYLFARARYQALMRRARGEFDRAPNSALMAVYARTETDSIRAGWARVDSLMQALARLSARNGFRVVVTNAPGSFVVSEVVKGRLATVAPGCDPDRPDRIPSEIADRSGFLYVNLLPRLTEAARRGKSLYWPEDGHWTKAGHQLVAETLYEAMQTNDVIR